MCFTLMLPPISSVAGTIGFYREPKPLLGVLRREALWWQQIVLEVFELA